MSYCLGCLACQTACPAGVNYGVLFETARSDIQRARRRRQRPRAASGAALTLELPVHAPAALRGAGGCCGSISARGLEALARRLGLTQAAPADLRRLEPQAPRDCARSSRISVIAAHEAPPGAARYRVALLTGCVQDLVFPDINRDTADVLLANGCEVDTPPIAAVLRLAARAQRRAGHGADARAADDRPRPAGALRRDHQQRRRLRLAPAALRAAARRRPGLRASGRSSGTASCVTSRNGSWRSAAARPRRRRSTRRRR